MGWRATNELLHVPWIQNGILFVHIYNYMYIYIHICTGLCTYTLVIFLWTCMTSLTGNCGISPQFWGYLKNWFALCTPPYVFVSPDLLDISLGLFRWQKQLEVGSCACQCPSARMVSRPRGPTVWTRRPANCVVEPLYKCHVVAQSAQYGRACECWRWKPLVHLSIFPTAAAIKHIVFPSTSHLIQDTLSLHLYRYHHNHYSASVYNIRNYQLTYVYIYIYMHVIIYTYTGLWWQKFHPHWIYHPLNQNRPWEQPIPSGK